MARGAGSWVRLCGGRDSLVDHPFGSGRVQELAAEVLEQPQRLWGHGEPTPPAAGAVRDRPDQAQAGRLAGEPADDLGAAAVSPKVRSMRLEWRILVQCSVSMSGCVWLVAGCSVLRV